MLRLEGSPPFSASARGRGDASMSLWGVAVSLGLLDFVVPGPTGADLVPGPPGQI